VQLDPSGCAGLVSGTTGNPPPRLCTLRTYRPHPPQTSVSQVVWTTNVAADSAVDYGTALRMGSSTPVNSAMVTSHQVTLSGLAAAPLLLPVSSTDSKGNHGNSGGIRSRQRVSDFGRDLIRQRRKRATLTLGGAANATTTADGLGSYYICRTTDGTFTVVSESRGFYVYSKQSEYGSQRDNVSAVNFTANAVPQRRRSRRSRGTRTVTGRDRRPRSRWWRRGRRRSGISGRRMGRKHQRGDSSELHDPATTTSDSGITFAVVVTNTAGR